MGGNSFVGIGWGISWAILAGLMGQSDAAVGGSVAQGRSSDGARAGSSAGWKRGLAKCVRLGGKLGD